MCGHCGCGNGAEATIRDLQTGRQTVLTHNVAQSSDSGGREHADESARRDGSAHGHPHHYLDHSHADDGPGSDGEHVHADGTRHRHDPHHHQGGHSYSHQRSSLVELEARVLAKNDSLAAVNRAWFAGREILALNLVSSPGAGKTTLLERTIREQQSQLGFFVVEGDQATQNDGERIRAAGAPVVQVNTGSGCHLEADMIARGLRALKPIPGSVVMIENVGNLVCPALFDLGEWAKVVIFSVTEGEDKPLKYPHMFRAAKLLVLNKVDLLPHLAFDVERAVTYAQQVNPNLAILRLSAQTGEGVEAWYGWLRQERSRAREAALV
jgi:hydrogenase nickel incorporation protein HypB